MSDMIIKDEDVFWQMHWGANFKDKPPTVFAWECNVQSTEPDQHTSRPARVGVLKPSRPKACGYESEDGRQVHGF